MRYLLSEAATEEIVTGKTFDDIYELVLELSADVSGLKNQVVILKDEIIELQDVIADKFDMLQNTLSAMPQYDQVDYLLALLFMLVGFEFMRLLKGWTNWFKFKGGKYGSNN